MPKAHNHGGTSPTPEMEQFDRPRTSFTPARMTRAVTSEDPDFLGQNFKPSMLARGLRLESAEPPRTIETGGIHLMPPPRVTGAVPREVPPSPRTVVPSTSFTEAAPQEPQEFPSTGIPTASLTRALTPGAVGPPETVNIDGFLYRRVDLIPEGDMTMSSIKHMGGLPDPNLHPYRLLNYYGRHPQGLVSSNVQPGRHFAGLAHDEGSAFQQASGVRRTIETDAQSTEAHSAESTRRKQKRRSKKILHDPEPYNESLEPRSEAPSETPQPMTRGIARPALPKQKRKPKMIRDLEPHNESPEPDSDSEKDVSAKRRHTSLMLREIQPHNESPERDSEPDMELFGDTMKEPLTRSKRRKIVSALRNESPPPRKILNLRKLMLEQLSGRPKGTKTFYYEDSSDVGTSSHQRQLESRQETVMNVEHEDEDEDEDKDEDEEDSLPTSSNTSVQSHSRQKSTRQMKSRQSGKPAGNSQQNQKVPAESPWSTWESDQARINELLKAPRYSPHPSQREMEAQGRKKPAYHATAETPEGIKSAFHMEGGVYVFTPTADTFLDFGSFLKNVEEVAGREMGVVKVIVPSECLSRIPTLGRGPYPRLPLVMKTTRVKLSSSEDAAEDRPEIYNMLMTDDSTSLKPNDLLNMIQRDRDTIINKGMTVTEATNGDKIWKDNHVVMPYTEERMIRRSVKDDGAVLSALSERVTNNLRATLRCRDPGIDHLLNNRFSSSRSTEAGINESVFHTASGPGPMSPLQMNKYAAYKLNYHHHGASRIVTVARPEHHGRLEDIMYTEQNSGNLFVGPSNPPACSQFVAHQPMYVPQTTLELGDVSHVELAQHQGEMVIIFPYAYHQAYTSGPNITEEMLYASDRCKVFHRQKLYQHCNPDCAAGEHDEFDVDLVFLNTLATSRSDRYRSSLESPRIVPPPRQSREASTSQYTDAATGRPIRLYGLKAMDRISDDGEWIDPSTQASRHKPSKPDKAARLTSNPHEPDMWDPAHAFGGPYGPANNDEGSPIGGIWPRDLVTGRPLQPGEWDTRRKRGNDDDEDDDDESDEPPRKHRRRRKH